MRPDGISRLARVSRPGSAPIGGAWRRHRLGRPLLAGLVLLAIGGALSTGRSLLDRGDGAALGSRSAWPTAVAGDLLEPAFGPALVLPAERAAATNRELDAALARLKGGPFGVVFEPVLGAPGETETGVVDPFEGEARWAPVVAIDAARPPLRLDIMGLAAPPTGETPDERRRGRMPETGP